MGKLPSNIETNTIKAQVHPKPQNKNTNKRKMDNNTVYLGSTGRVTKMTGDNIVWEKQLGALYATPHVVVGKFGLYAAARRKLYELDPDTGAILSSVKIRSVSKVSNMGAHLQVDAAAEALYFVCNKGVAKVRTDVALDDPSAIAWERRVKKFSGPASTSLLDTSANVLSVSTSGSVYALATDNGYLLARNKFACKLHTTFTLALDGSGSLVAADRGNLYPAPAKARPTLSPRSSWGPPRCLPAQSGWSTTTTATLFSVHPTARSLPTSPRRPTPSSGSTSSRGSATGQASLSPSHPRRAWSLSESRAALLLST